MVVVAVPSAALIGHGSEYSMRDEGEALLRGARRVGLAAGDRVREAANDAAERPVLGLVVANVVVHALWRVLPPRVMVRHFTSTVEALRAGRAHTLATANFSHADALHLGGNMLGLALIGPDVVQHLNSAARFLELYLAAGVVGMGASAAWKALARRPLDATVGASAAVLGAFGSSVAARPDEDVLVLGAEMTRRELLALVLAVDLAIAAVLRNVAVLGHLGGVAAGVAYSLAIRERLDDEAAWSAGWQSMWTKEPDTPLLAVVLWRRYVRGDDSRN